MNRDKEDASGDAVVNEIESKSRMKRLRVQGVHPLIPPHYHVWSGSGLTKDDYCKVCGRWRD